MKGFLFLLIGALVLGGGLGGAFGGGVALGRSQGQAQSTPVAQAAPIAAAQPSDAPSPELAGRSRQRPATGGTAPEGSSQPPQQPPGSSRPGFAVWGGLAGTIEKVEGGTATINTAQGLVQTTLGNDTAVQRLTRGGSVDLQVGLRVTVFGQRRENGTVLASTVLIVPNGDGGFFQ